MWAEQVGLGEMGLMPRDFWSLTVREFWIKHNAFARSEDRRRSLMMEQVTLSVQRKDADQNALKRTMNALRRYPVKPWLK